MSLKKTITLHQIHHSFSHEKAVATNDPVKVASKPSTSYSMASTLQRILSPVSTSSQGNLRSSPCCHRWTCNPENILTENSKRKLNFLSTPFFCSVILLSIFVFIVAGVILLYHSSKEKPLLLMNLAFFSKASNT